MPLAEVENEVRAGRGPITIWTNADIAQQAVDRAVSDYFYGHSATQNAKNQAAFRRWAAKARVGEPYAPIDGQWDAYASLGKIYSADSVAPNGVAVADVGNKVRVILIKWPHKGSGGYLVYTSRPFGQP